MENEGIKKIRHDEGLIGEKKTSHRCKCRVAIFVVIGILCFVALLSAQITMNALVSAPFARKQQVSGVFPVAKRKTSVGGAVFAVLALGPQAYQMNCPAAVESLVKYGGWGGDVYLITDRESCFDRDEIVRNAGMEDSRLHLEVLDEDFGGGGIDIFNPKLGFAKNRMRSKSMKTHLFEIITDPDIEVVAFMDCDILIANEGCPVEYLQSGDPWQERGIQFTRTETDELGRLTSIHTGTIMMHRHYSSEILRIWAEELDKHESSMDRFPYLIAYNRLQREIEERAGVYPLLPNSTHGTNITALLAKNPLLAGEARRRGTVGNIKVHFENFVQPESQSPFCFNHISKARCEAYGRDRVQAFVNKFDQLKTYPNGALYCPSVWFTPLLYGYMPLSYLPWCPKVENFL